LNQDLPQQQEGYLVVTRFDDDDSPEHEGGDGDTDGNQSIEDEYGPLETR
jgi:hypothetical protein